MGRKGDKIRGRNTDPYVPTEILKNRRRSNDIRNAERKTQNVEQSEFEYEYVLQRRRAYVHTEKRLVKLFGAGIFQRLLLEVEGLPGRRVSYENDLSGYVRYFQRLALYALRFGKSSHPWTGPLSWSRPGARPLFLSQTWGTGATITCQHFQRIA